MPELPEVETVKIQLNKFLTSHKIEDVTIHTPKVFTGSPKDVIGAKIKRVRRFAKVISIDLSNGNSLVIHIKLTGQLIYRGPNLKNPSALSKKVFGLGDKHTHVIFKLDKGGTLYFNDVRKFGWIKVMKTNLVETSGFVSKLGPEPLNGLTQSLFEDIASKSKRPIKVILMDQEKIGGVGNIYANDALLLSKIHPKRPSNSLTKDEQKKLYNSIVNVLKKGIEFGGASELSYVHPDGSEGGYQKHFIAYGKDGQLCPVCKKEKIVKIRVGGRGTYFCPNCQKI